MALSEQSRHQIFDYFANTELGVEVTSEMLSYFPARDVEEPVTKEHLSTELAALRLEFRTELHDSIGGLRDEMHREIGSLRSEIGGEIGSLRGEIGTLRGEFGTLRSEIGGEIGSLRDQMHHQFSWLMGTTLTMIATMVAVLIAVLIALA